MVYLHGVYLTIPGLDIHGGGWEAMLPGHFHIQSTKNFTGHLADPYIQEFVRNFRAKYDNETPTIFSTYVYDSIYLIAAALKGMRGEVTRGAIRDALCGLKDEKTLSGTLSCRKNGHFGPRKMVTVIVSDGTFKFYKSL